MLRWLLASGDRSVLSAESASTSPESVGTARYTGALVVSCSCLATGEKVRWLVPSLSDRYTVESSEETAQAKVGAEVDGEVVFTTKVKMPGVDEEVGGAVVVPVEVLTLPYVEVLAVVELDVVLAVVVLEVVLAVVVLDVVLAVVVLVVVLVLVVLVVDIPGVGQVGVPGGTVRRTGGHLGL